MLVNLYSIPVYKTKLSEHEQVQEDFSEILDSDEYFNKVSTWYSPVDTTYGNPEATNLPFKGSFFIVVLRILYMLNYILLI